MDDLVRYISSTHRTAVETAAALGVLILELGGHLLETADSHPGLVSLSPLQVQPQVRDLAHQRLKPGLWQAVVGHLNFGSRHWKHYLDLLRLSDQVLELAQQHRLSERALREITRLQDSGRQMAAVQTLIAGQSQHARPHRHTRTSGPTPGDLVPEEMNHGSTSPRVRMDRPDSGSPAPIPGPSPEMPDLDRLSGLLMPLHGFLVGLAAEAQWALAQRLVEPDTTQSFLLLRDTSGQLHRLLTAVYSQGESVCLDDMDDGEIDTSKG